jgi:hypothetical protein
VPGDLLLLRSSDAVRTICGLVAAEHLNQLLGTMALKDDGLRPATMGHGEQTSIGDTKGM